MVAEQFKTAWEVHAENGDLAAAVVSYVKRNDWVTFVELQREFESYLPTRGDMSLVVEQANVVLWSGLSTELYSLLQPLIDGKRIFLHTGSWLSYACDGGMLKMPIAKKVPKNGYKQEHWLPTCLRAVPHRVMRG